MEKYLQLLWHSTDASAKLREKSMLFYVKKVYLYQFNHLKRKLIKQVASIQHIARYLLDLYRLLHNRRPVQIRAKIDGHMSTEQYLLTFIRLYDKTTSRYTLKCIEITI